MNVDVHSHIVDREYLDNLASTLALATESTNDGKRLFRKDGSTVAWSRDDMFDIDRRLDDMDKKDIAVRIMSLSAPNVYLWNGVDHVAAARHINDALAKPCRHYPDRLVGLASLPLKDIEASLGELDRCVNELGMKGVTIGSNIDGLQVDDPKFEQFGRRSTRFVSRSSSTRCSLATAQDLRDLNCHCGSDSSSTPPSRPRGSSTRVSLNDTRTFLISWRIQVARC
jgi:aminocarboxymuconate-semialdehyde decarboxylase